MSAPDKVMYWGGTMITELDRDGLLKVIDHLVRENGQLRDDCASYRKHVDWESFVRDPRQRI
ncbi:hypothetical protein ISN76_13040 [Dyella halodurans]|uniref:Uncharacterized protein n=1 Tax=Dyella halodurans TaxID=1920171 RepID=A0ABV9C0Q1_9GAMM|nr:hypothetical protein [Dyella halodurans]